MEDLVAKYFSGETSEEENDQVQEWRSASESNAKEFLQLKKIWLESAPSGPADQNILTQILDDTPAGVEVIPLWNQKLFRIAAVLVLAMGVIFTILNLSKEQPYGVVLAENTEFKLPDGSRVTVHRGGKLEPGDFEASRDVILTGKAFFDVRRDKKRPFTVTTRGAVVEVMGTSFMVASYPEDPVTKVMVNSGTVAMRQNPEFFQGKSLRIELREGEMGELEIGKRGIRKKRITDENYLAWKTGIITFRKKSMVEVAEVIKDVYDVDFVFKNPMISKCSLSASFKEKTADEVAEIIAETFSFTYEKNGNTVTFVGEGCD